MRAPETLQTQKGQNQLQVKMNLRKKFGNERSKEKMEKYKYKIDEPCSLKNKALKVSAKI